MKLSIENIVRAVRLAKYIKTGRGPLGIDLSLTNRCNFNCFFCGNRGQESCDMDTDMLDCLLSGLKDMGTKEITLSGNGEPTLYETFWPVVNRCYLDGMKVKLVTNGSNLGQIDKRRYLMLHKLTVSLNSIDPDVHKLIHCYGGQSRLYSILRNISRLLAIDAKRIQINYVECSYNAIEDTSAIEKKWGLKFVKRIVNDGHCNLRKSALPCYAGYYGGFIESNGNYRICVYSYPVGNLRDKPLSQLYRENIDTIKKLTKGYMHSYGCMSCPDVEMYSKDFHLVGRYLN
jgi:MoaA/NifB/PqqE/SkfB family radical SAM enzyme